MKGITPEHLAKLRAQRAENPDIDSFFREQEKLELIELEKQHRQQQTALKEQLAISAELNDVQLRFHNVVESLLVRGYITRDDGRKLFRSVDAPLSNLILELQRLLLVDGQWFKAPYLDLSNEDQP